MTTLNYRKIPDAVRYRDPFQGNSMSAERLQPGDYISRYGILPDAERDILIHAWEDAKRFGERLYVVYSYATPIAWGLDDRPLYVPDVRYSATTSRQQAICRRSHQSPV